MSLIIIKLEGSVTIDVFNNRKCNHMSNDHPLYVSYVISRDCVANCVFCITPKEANVPEVDTASAKTIIDKCIASNVCMISLAGREPFLRKDIWEIIEYIKSKSVKLNIETTATTLTNNDIDRLIDLQVDWLSMSIDGLQKDDTKTMGRPFVSRDLLYTLCDKFRKSSICSLKVNTVVSRQNMNEITNIGKLINTNPPTVWKLRQYTMRGAGLLAEVAEKYYITTDLFSSLVDCVKRTFDNIFIEDCTNTQYKGTLIMIKPNGDLIVPYNEKEFHRGNLLENTCEIIDVWRDGLMDRELHKKNYYETYIRPLQNVQYCSIEYI